jgi:hypothetical protein
MAGHAIAWCDHMEEQGYDVPEHMYTSFYDLRGQYKRDPEAVAAGDHEQRRVVLKHLGPHGEKRCMLNQDRLGTSSRQLIQSHPPKRRYILIL